MAQSQALAFGELLAGGVMLTAGITGHSVRDILAGKSSPIKPLTTDFPTGASTAAPSAAGGSGGAATSAPTSGGGGQLASNPVNVAVSRKSKKAAKLAGTSAKALKAAKGVGTFDGQKVALWIVPILQYARAHGWTGSVTSGYRSFADQTRIYNSGVRPAAIPGTSNHEGDAFPRGAVDVSQAAQLSKILLASPFRKLLVYAGSKDPVHFSHPHNGSY